MKRQEIEAALHEARREQLNHGHDWDVADVMPVVLDLLKNAWDEGSSNATSYNPYEKVLE